MRTALDTNILLSIRESKQPEGLGVLRKIVSQSGLCICPVVYAEIGARFASKTELDSFLFELGVETEAFSDEAAFQAGQMFRDYLRKVGSRQRILPDFLIGAHAMHQASQLLTHDRGFYRQYFRGLRIIEP